MAGIARACSYPLVHLARLDLSKSAQYEKLLHLPEHGEGANGSAIPVLVFEARVIPVMFSNFGLEGAA